MLLRILLGVLPQLWRLVGGNDFWYGDEHDYYDDSAAYGDVPTTTAVTAAAPVQDGLSASDGGWTAKISSVWKGDEAAHSAGFAVDGRVRASPGKKVGQKKEPFSTFRFPGGRGGCPSVARGTSSRPSPSAWGPT